MRIKNKVRLEFEKSKKSIIFDNSSTDLLLIPLSKLFGAEKELKTKIYLRNWVNNKAGVQQTVHLYGSEAEITEKIKKYLL
jgi:hypothetical protein